MKDDNVWKENTPLTLWQEKKNNCLDLQPKEEGLAKTTSCSTEFISV